MFSVFLAQCETEENFTEQAEIPSTSGENPQQMELSVSPLNFSDEESEDEICNMYFFVFLIYFFKTLLFALQNRQPQYHKFPKIRHSSMPL